jgi:hypothetical protein
MSSDYGRLDYISFRRREICQRNRSNHNNFQFYPNDAIMVTLKGLGGKKMKCDDVVL